MKDAMKTIAMILSALALSGCATLGLNLEDTRVACTAAKDKAFAISDFGVLIAGKIHDADRAAICK